MEKIKISDIYALKVQKQKFSVITCYDYTTAALIAQTDVEAVMVGDSAVQVMLGEESTLPATMDYMAIITKAVRKGCPSKLLVADMPFLSYQTGIKDALLNAGRFVADCGADIVKFEVNESQIDVVRQVSDAGIAVMAHLGMRPQSIKLTGNLKAQGANAEDAAELITLSRLAVKAGAKMLLLEGTAREVAAIITAQTDVPVISCGAGPDCDGQVLVISDVLGLHDGFMPKFAKRFANIGEQITKSVSLYDSEVKGSRYPSDEQSYHMKAGEAQKLEKSIDNK